MACSFLGWRGSYGYASVCTCVCVCVSLCVCVCVFVSVFSISFTACLCDMNNIYDVDMCKGCDCLFVCLKDCVFFLQLNSPEPNQLNQVTFHDPKTETTRFTEHILFQTDLFCFILFYFILYFLFYSILTHHLIKWFAYEPIINHLQIGNTLQPGFFLLLFLFKCFCSLLRYVPHLVAMLLTCGGSSCCY